MAWPAAHAAERQRWGAYRRFGPTCQARPTNHTDLFALFAILGLNGEVRVLPLTGTVHPRQNTGKGHARRSSPRMGELPHSMDDSNTGAPSIPTIIRTSDSPRPLNMSALPLQFPCTDGTRPHGPGADATSCHNQPGAAIGRFMNPASWKRSCRGSRPAETSCSTLPFPWTGNPCIRPRIQDVTL